MYSYHKSQLCNKINMLLGQEREDQKFILNSFHASIYKKTSQSASAFLIIFTKLSWLPEYFVVWIFKQSIYEKKEQSLKKKTACQIFAQNQIQNNDQGNKDRVDWVHPKLAQSYYSLWVQNVLCNVRQFLFICCWMFGDHANLLVRKLLLY